MADLKTLTSAITAFLDNPPLQISEAERVNLLGLIERLQSVVETPRDRIMTISHSQFLPAMTRVAQGMGVFDAFLDSGSSGLSLSELSSKTKGDEKLLARLMRFLSAYDVFREAGTVIFSSIPLYKATPIALTLAHGTAESAIFKHQAGFTPISASLNDYLASTRYQNPTDAYNGPMQFARRTTAHHFDWLASNPEAQEAFNTTMAMLRVMSEPWFELYPVAEQLGLEQSLGDIGLERGKVRDDDRVLLVDVGGNKGDEILAFRAAFPDVPGQLVMAHDMFDPQPVKNAKIYLLRRILLDWPDKEASQVLRNIREAMVPGSVVLIHDIVYPEHGQTGGGRGAREAADLDLVMMDCFSALIRTVGEWRAEVALFEAVVGGE
ncbi:S-adenosyl-L-methionine-dependent methyltransferase [Aspergillus stella-maris]|uniref:S-adenosyl-L-methionine-dependent methyltransferase n=1 Tax=Aspergillus stella-maris TaxID=1810926 RepID=UPI003CCDFE12